MSQPTVLGPWYIVQTTDRDLDGSGYGLTKYYTSMEENSETWTEDPHRALIFMSLHSASRAAQAEGAIIRVLTTKEEADEFGRG